MDSLFGMNLLTEGRDVVVCQDGSVECVDAFPGCGAGMGGAAFVSDDDGLDGEHRTGTRGGGGVNHKACIHVFVGSFFFETDLASSAFFCGCAEENDRSGDVLSDESGSD